LENLKGRDSLEDLGIKGKYSNISQINKVGGRRVDQPDSVY
jgi:hypothetical protein